jgi:hypothetical protein
MFGKLVRTKVLPLNKDEYILTTHIQKKKLPIKKVSKRCSDIIREAKLDEERVEEMQNIKNLHMFSFDIPGAIDPTQGQVIEELKETIDSEILFNPETKVIDRVNNNTKLEQIILSMIE